MTIERVYTAVLVEDTTTYSIVEVCQKYCIPKALVLEMIEQGIFNVQSTSEDQVILDQTDLRRMESAFRLHRDLGINLPGVALAIELLDQIEHLHRQLDILNKHFK